MPSSMRGIYVPENPARLDGSLDERNLTERDLSSGGAFEP
jgi:hypothetical protein